MTKKIEWIYREILFQSMEKKQLFLSQSSISKKCNVSIGIVFKAIHPLVQMNCIEKKPRGFHVINPKKILLYWASIRNLQKDIIYQTRSEKPVNDIEKAMPQVMFSAYSGFNFRFNDIPSDYSEVIVYSSKEKVFGRFPFKKGVPNIIVLKQDCHLKKFKKVTLGQLFVDLWNLNTWYANDFIKTLENKFEKWWVKE